jgi:hypothetical protein
MRWWFVPFLLSVLLLLLLPACGVENPPVLEDTTGAEVGWECVAGSCSPSIQSWSPQVPSMCGEETELLVGAGALAILCAVSVEGGRDVVHERTCRPIACADELDCPQWEAREYRCDNELCQTFIGMDRIDIASLCLWDLPRHASCSEADEDPEVDRRIALVDAACAGEECTIPEGCLAP